MERNIFTMIRQFFGNRRVAAGIYAGILNGYGNETAAA